MKLYDLVELKKEYKKYPKGTKCIVVEIFNDEDAYLEVLNANGDTVGMLYGVPLNELVVLP